MYDDDTLLSNNINRLTQKTTSDIFTTPQDVLRAGIFYILCHKWPYPLDMVLTSLPGTIFGLRASEVSDVVGTSSSNRVALVAVHAKAGSTRASRGSDPLSLARYRTRYWFHRYLVSVAGERLQKPRDSFRDSFLSA